MVVDDFVEAGSIEEIEGWEEARDLLEKDRVRFAWRRVGHQEPNIPYTLTIEESATEDESYRVWYRRKELAWDTLRKESFPELEPAYHYAMDFMETHPELSGIDVKRDYRDP